MSSIHSYDEAFSRFEPKLSKSEFPQFRIELEGKSLGRHAGLVLLQQPHGNFLEAYDATTRQILKQISLSDPSLFISVSKSPQYCVTLRRGGLNEESKSLTTPERNGDEIVMSMMCPTSLTESAEDFVQRMTSLLPTSRSQRTFWLPEMVMEDIFTLIDEDDDE